MGIQGLIPFLEKASKPANVSEFSGGSVVIDAYCWLHKGVFSCAEKLARGDDCDMYVSYCMKFVNMLLAKNIKPVLVFDGQKLPAKKETEQKRRESREQNRKRAAELMRLDRGKEAQTYLRRCIDITHEMALNLIRACRARNVDCIVAPYEADAQLAFLNIENLAVVIITEDSDLLLFGAKKVLFKMDVNGNGLLIEQNKLYIAMGVKEQEFSLDKFRYMCILSGCDYLPSLPGIGLVKACRFIKSTVDSDIYRALTRISLHLNMPQLCVTQEYRDKFLDADFMFKYQPVYDPRKRCLRPLTQLDPQHENYVKYKNLINQNNLSEEQLKNLAYGNLDPFKLTSMDNWSPSKKVAPITVHRKVSNISNVALHPSIWSEDYVPNSWAKPKVSSAPPNALCPSAMKSHREAHFERNRSATQRPLSTKKIILPTAKLNCFTRDNTEDEGLSKTATTTSATPLHKKAHHNPFLKSQQCKSTVVKNVSMLDKLQRLYENAATETNCVVRSGYFGNSKEVAANTSPEAPCNSSDHRSPCSSPEIVGRSSKTKAVLCVEDKNDDSSQSDRSPLKTLNTSSADFGTLISYKYSTPPSLLPTNNDEENEPDLLGKEITRKRTIPFATTSTEKKSRTAGFIEKLNSFRRHSVTSSFSWTQPEESESGCTLKISTSTAVASYFKNPMVGDEASSKSGSVKVCSQLSNEDEGFCSPNSGSDASVSDASRNSPVIKRSWTSCRTPGLKKGVPKQLSLDQYAFKSAIKMRR